MNYFSFVCRLSCLFIGISLTAQEVAVQPAYNLLDKDKAAAIDSIFQYTDKPDHPGAALGIIKDGKLVYAKGYGYANLEYDIPLTPHSVFRIASTSKQFTAACIVLLAQEGTLSLDDTLASFFPDFPAYAEDITVRQLLHHTSGIRDYLVLTSLQGLEDDDYYTDADLMQLLQKQQALNFSPGEEHLYSNSGYWLLGQIVKKVTGHSMAVYAKNKLFDPLGMSETHFHDDHTLVVKNRASGYYPKQNGSFGIAMTTLDMIGDGGVFTTVADLKKWDDAYYKRTLLNDAFWDTMTTEAKLNDGTPLNYAAGLVISTYKGLHTISHGGAFVGFRAEMIRFPEQQFSIIVLANRADANPTELGYRVANLFIDEYVPAEDSISEPVEIPDAKTQPETLETKPITLSRKQLEAFEGDYWSEENQFGRRLAIINDTLTYVRTNGRQTKMIPIGPGKFLWDNDRYEIVLTLDDAKSPKAFTLEIPGEEPSLYTRYEPVRKLSESDLANYLGSYYSKELDVTYTFEARSGGIMTLVDGKPLAPAAPVMRDRFTVANYLSLKFAPDQQSFLASAGRVKNLQFVKMKK